MIRLARYASHGALLILILAAGLKMVRYGSPADLTDTAALGRLAPFMASAGWSKAAPVSGRAGNLYTWTEFSHADCPRSITVAFLGTSTEAHDLLQLDHDGNVAFVQGGHVVTRPSGLHRQLSSLQAAVARLLGWREPVLLPLLGIAPAPQRNGDACTGPTKGQWEAFARGEFQPIRAIVFSLRQPD